MTEQEMWDYLMMGPWEVHSYYDPKLPLGGGWSIVNKITGKSKKVGPVRSKGTNYCDKARWLAAERNKALSYLRLGIEIRVRKIGDDRPWMEIAYRTSAVWHETVDGRIALAQTTATAYLSLPDVREVRWNVEGSLQGHYLQPGADPSIGAVNMA